MTIKKTTNKVAKYLRKTFNVSFIDACKLGKAFAKTYTLTDMNGVLTALAGEASCNESLNQVFSRYFKVDIHHRYDSFDNEFIVWYDVIPLN